MVRKNEQSKISKAFWRILISVVGIALILIAVGSLLLFFFGESTTVNINIRRYGGADDNRAVNQRYEWSLDYTFQDKEGNTHSGHTYRRGSDISVNVDSRVYYFAFAPFISSLESEAEPNIGQPLYIAIGIFLLFVLNRKKSKKVPD